LEAASERGSIFAQELAETYINMMNIDIIAGTGGLLSHAPDRIQSMLVLIDAWQPEGVTWMFQDSVFMMPHLGILSTVYRNAAWNIFDKDCLVRLGTVIAPSGSSSKSENVMTVTFKMPDGSIFDESVGFEEIKRISFKEGEVIKATIEPSRNFDVGEGSGHRIEAEIMGGRCGILLDGRGRPLQLPSDTYDRIELLREWFKAVEMYPDKKIQKIL